MISVSILKEKDNYEQAIDKINNTDTLSNINEAKKQFKVK